MVEEHFMKTYWHNGFKVLMVFFLSLSLASCNGFEVAGSLSLSQTEERTSRAARGVDRVLSNINRVIRDLNPYTLVDRSDFLSGRSFDGLLSSIDDFLRDGVDLIRVTYKNLDDIEDSIVLAMEDLESSDSTQDYAYGQYESLLTRVRDYKSSVRETAFSLTRKIDKIDKVFDKMSSKFRTDRPLELIAIVLIENIRGKVVGSYNTFSDELRDIFNEDD